MSQNKNSDLRNWHVKLPAVFSWIDCLYTVSVRKSHFFPGHIEFVILSSSTFRYDHDIYVGLYIYNRLLTR